MSLLSDYESRTAWKYDRIQGFFHTPDDLTRKVNPDGSYAPYPGSTVVFRAGYACIQIIQMMQHILYQRLESNDLLSARLPASTIHMTLHDLISPDMRLSALDDQAAYSKEVSDSILKASEIVEAIRREYAGHKIIMISDRIVNMVSKSLVLMLRPQTEQDFELLLDMYHRFDSIQSLPYPLTPHITLAYFKPGMLDGNLLGDAVEYMQINLENAPVFSFYPEDLTAQSFQDMQTYYDVPVRICFCCDGGLNRSVMAANILTHLAQKRNLPIVGQARSAFQNTQGRQVPPQVWSVLESHGIQPDTSYSVAKYLDTSEVSHFTAFAEITAGAVERIARLNLPREKADDMRRFFFGVRDPEYGEVSYEDAFQELYGRVEAFLDVFQNEYLPRQLK